MNIDIRRKRQQVVGKNRETDGGILRTWVTAGLAAKGDIFQFRAGVQGVQCGQEC